MMNFTFLKEKPNFNSFSTACIEAEQSLSVSPSMCVISTRRALELAVKWVYQFDNDVAVPYRDNLSTLIHAQQFLNIIDPDLIPLIKYIVKAGNVAVHTNAAVNRDAAILGLRNLYEFIAWIDYRYAKDYTATEFDETLLQVGSEKRERPEILLEISEQMRKYDTKLDDLRKFNEELRQEITLQRDNNIRAVEFHVNDLSEFETRKKYIDLDLKLAGWEFGNNLEVEVSVEGMPNKSKSGFVDYVMYGDNGKPIGIIEAKRTTIDPKEGRQQAKLYADALERKTGQRPVIFYSNGFTTYIWQDDYPARQTSGFYTKEDLQLIIDRRDLKKPLLDITINDDISNRYYQKEAIIATCDALENNQRKMLLVMATGSGKTRTAISLVDVLTERNWVKNVLFLADRTALLKQAFRNFNHLMPHLTLCNLLESKENPEDCRMVFSTYATMMNAIDNQERKGGGKLFTVGHFDLIIIDESHRSIYQKYSSIFDYFDGLLVGLTATPKGDIDKNTYSVFDLENGVPTFGYELDKAVDDEFLVNYRTMETTTTFMDEGIRYDNLSEEEKAEYEEIFGDDPVPKDIDGNALNKWLFNINTIDQVLKDMMANGIKIEGGDKIGKTIIFAKNHKHANLIKERFDILFPYLGGSFAELIDYSINYYQSLIDDFSVTHKMPQIAISVDMLDTGIDVPEVVNLVLFKKIRSKVKFWQIIGRGTRLCPDLFGPGQNKDHFIVFDYCRNFEFFRANKNGIVNRPMKTLTERLFNVQVDIVRETQGLEYQTDFYSQYRQRTLDDILNEIQKLEEENFRNRQYIQYIDKYRDPSNWQAISAVQSDEIKQHISPLIPPIQGDELVKRFDLLILTIEAAYFDVKNATSAIKKVMLTAEELSKFGTLPQVKEQKEIIQKAREQEFWEAANVEEIEEVRFALRELVRLIPAEVQKIYYTNFQDEIIEQKGNGPLVNGDELVSYRQKVEYYLKAHQDHITIRKLRQNKALTRQELENLEGILWKELGTREQYTKDFGDTPITKLVRQIVGVDQKAANKAFSEFLSNEHLNAEQTRFVKLIVDYIVKNGMLENKVLEEEPFKTVGSISTIFKDNISDAKKVIKIIETFNRNLDIS
ncbi:DEAD/DEAH box helicase [Listeria newyorkensis]|uniref:DEAD/DEAH box helicase n=1 Tax=Listeria newyorkensis TaxID=1497681 RepID=A0ABX4XIN4_9LIST|nr:DEAD/DEAH box helicase family protein [Listeria newyorkensis]KGL43264.1 DEAD/DEAH box helicase [Listeria newyorkensis]PNP88535.1 DEAD/DEAH box helicase [Listeria newyorkensis]WAO22407.1 DEAD/DEAH box helicase family protein [Listeria newyorkensis]SQC50690.1 type I restriction enzyme EcoKI subunit R [Listeria newyorkensis]